MINPHWFELPMSRTNFHGPKDVRAIEVRLYVRIQSRHTQSTDELQWSNFYYSISLIGTFCARLQNQSPSADSRRAVVSFWRKNVHNTG